MEKEPASENKAPRRRGKNLLLVLLFLVGFIGGVVYVMLPPKEPSYNGKSLTVWLQEYRETRWGDPTDPKLIASRDAIQHIGADAIPTLLHMLRARDSALKTKLMDWNDEHDFFNFKFMPAEERNDMALICFHLLGERASNAIPAVIDIYNHASPQNDRAKLVANSVLMGMYPAAGATNPSWTPSNERVAWFIGAGAIRNNSGDFTNAVRAFSEAIKLDAASYEAWSSRASARMQLRDFAGALADARKACELDPKSTDALYTVGLCKFSLRDFKGAEEDLTTVIKGETNNAGAYNFRGLARANLRKVDEAMADYNKAIQLNASDASAYRNRAAAEAIQQELEIALADCSKSIDLNSKDPFAYLVRGHIKAALKDYKAALPDFDRFIELNPKVALGYAGRAFANAYLDNFETADSDLEKALQLDPKTVIIYAARGFLRVKRGDDEGALSDFEHAVELGDQPADMHTLLGLFQYKTGKWESALENCRKALELRAQPWAHTEDLTAYVWLIRAQTGQEKEANAELVARLPTIQGMKTKAWETSIGRYFSGSLSESNFLGEATSTARRPSAIKGQVSESLYYVGMKRKLAGDEKGAVEMFQKCLDYGDHNNLGYMNAWVEMKKLKK